jgi:hypothetical protein
MASNTWQSLFRRFMRILRDRRRRRQAGGSRGGWD